MRHGLLKGQGGLMAREDVRPNNECARHSTCVLWQTALIASLLEPQKDALRHRNRERNHRVHWYRLPIASERSSQGDEC